MFRPTVITGIEGMAYSDHRLDTLAVTRHDTLFDQDFALVKDDLGIECLRYPLMMNRVMRDGSTQMDWSWTDSVMASASAHGIKLIADPLHHTTFPAWLKGGVIDKDFPEAYARFMGAAAQRYPQIQQWTLFNEPLATTWLSAGVGAWSPYLEGSHTFVRSALNVAKAMSLAWKRVGMYSPSATSVYIDTCERHVAVNSQSEEAVNFRLDRRFLMLDLSLGLIDAAHPLYDWLLKHGATESELVWLREHPIKIDVLGLDYYLQSEWEVDVLGEAKFSSRPVGPAVIAKEYMTLLCKQTAFTGKPVQLAFTETNLRSTSFRDRITWLKFMVGQAESLLAQGYDLQMFGWYPLFSVDWDTLVKDLQGHPDPQGLVDLQSGTMKRVPTELSYWYSLLAQGNVGSADIPAYSFSPEVADAIKGYLPLMKGYEWQ
jgi:hypothetical protein